MTNGQRHDAARQNIPEAFSYKSSESGQNGQPVSSTRIPMDGHTGWSPAFGHSIRSAHERTYYPIKGGWPMCTESKCQKNPFNRLDWLPQSPRGKDLIDKMAAVHRAIFIWFWLLIFIILLVLRLDDKVEWNYFVVFLPMWILDSAFFGASMVRFTQIMKSRPRSSASNTNNATAAALAAHGLKMRRALGAAVAAIFALAFQILLCTRLQYKVLELYYVMIPFWLLLLILLGDFTYRLVYIYRQ